MEGVALHFAHMMRMTCDIFIVDAHTICQEIREKIIFSIEPRVVMLCLKVIKQQECWEAVNPILARRGPMQMMFVSSNA